MSRSALSLAATILGILGVAVVLGHPHWGLVTGAVFLVLAGAIGAGVLRTPTDDYLSEQKLTGRKISNGLVTLSSAAILAIYAAGYHRTTPAAEKFEELAARRRAATPVIIAPVAPTVATTTITPPSGPRPVVPRYVPFQNDTSDVRPSKANRKAKPAPATPVEPTTSYSGLPSATATSVPPPEPSGTDANASSAKYKDGTFMGWGTSRHGDIQASVVIKEGRIISTAITQCRTRYSCSVIVHLPGQVIERQSATVDLVSGATESSDAFSDAIAAALMSASE